MKGKGNPVGGIEPINISYCIVDFYKKKEQIYCSLPHLLQNIESLSI